MSDEQAVKVDQSSLPERGIALLAGVSSIGSLLLYFSGWLGFADGVRYVLVPGMALGIATLAWAIARDRRACAHTLLSGVWAGLLATFAYDVVRARWHIRACQSSRRSRTSER